MPVVLANDVQLHYETQGAGPALVLIHGLGSSTRDWEPQVAEFSQAYQVITFDLRGHGQSAKPAGPYSVPLFAADLDGLLQALQIPSAHVVGISLGGGIALQAAIDYPARVKTLTVVNSAPTLGDPELARQEIERRVGIVSQYGLAAMGQALSQALFPQPEFADLRASFVGRWAENDPTAYIAATRSMLNWDVTSQLGTIHCPTLILAADQDYTPVAVKEAYARLIPGAQLVVIPEAHHAVPIEHPARFNAALGRFLAEHA